MQALWMALGALFFAFMGVCIKLASSDYSSMEIVFYRGLTGMVLFSIIMAVRKIPLYTPVPRLHIQRNLAGVTAMSLWFYAIGQLPFATGMTLNNMSSVWIGAIVIGSAWWKTKKIGYPPLYHFQVGAAVGVEDGPATGGHHQTFTAAGAHRRARKQQISTVTQREFSAERAVGPVGT